MSATTACIPTGRPRPRYDTYLREHGYDGDNPWEHWANSGAGRRRLAAERLAAGARRQGGARAGRAFRDALHDAPRDGLHRRGRSDGRPWCLHLSYIKPHWPYIAPEPYASMYGAADMLPAVRSEKERQEAASGVRRLHGHALLAQHVRATKRARRSSRPIWA